MQSIVSQMDEDIQKLVQEMQGSVTLAVLIWQGLKLGRLIAVRVIEAIILERVQTCIAKAAATGWRAKANSNANW